MDQEGSSPAPSTNATGGQITSPRPWWLHHAIDRSATHQFGSINLVLRQGLASFKFDTHTNFAHKPNGRGPASQRKQVSTLQIAQVDFWFFSSLSPSSRSLRPLHKNLSHPHSTKHIKNAVRHAGSALLLAAAGPSHILELEMGKRRMSVAPTSCSWSIFRFDSFRFTCTYVFCLVHYRSA